MRVGIIGFAGSGKDTIAKMLQEQLWEQGYCCGIERFASPLKDLARAVFGNDFDDRSVKEVLVPFTHEMKQVAYSEIKAIHLAARQIFGFPLGLHSIAAFALL